MTLRRTAGKAASLLSAETQIGSRALCSGCLTASTPEQGLRRGSAWRPMPSVFSCLFATSAEAEKQKRSQDRETIISVLESSATRRDAKAYLKTFAPDSSEPRRSDVANGKDRTAHSALPDSIRAVSERPLFVQGPLKELSPEMDRLPHVAIVTFRDPQAWTDDTLDGVAKTLHQLRMLGLHSLIIVDCELDQASHSRWRKILSAQTDRIASAIGKCGTPGAKVVDSALALNPAAAARGHIKPFAHNNGVFVGFEEALTSVLRSDHLIVIPSLAYANTTLGCSIVDADDVVLALTTYLSGLQFSPQSEDGTLRDVFAEPVKRASVDRIIVLDPHGGTPLRGHPYDVRVFVNMEEEFEGIEVDLKRSERDPRAQSRTWKGPESPTSYVTRPKHLQNLVLAKTALAMLPPTSSAVITTPVEATNPTSRKSNDATSGPFGSVGTRRKQNPLIHNLLTDRPVYSSSLPPGRIKSTPQGADTSGIRSSGTTLAKRGIPVTIFPDPKERAWLPPTPGSPRLRLTDTCIDLTRLVHLIEDSFNRKLDVQHYLARVESSLAGVIIAGEYEGGAILTWERPFGLDERTAFDTGRLVPYLDKFAVLKRSQGAGGVADVVFNAMVRDCFPDGVCWRSRKDNPVNKWYFERSRGAWKLGGSNWAMFWTTPDAALDGRTVRDYEDVCRKVVPSWTDKGMVAD